MQALAPANVEQLAAKLVEFLETGVAPDGLFAPDAFVDFTPPRWRLQAQGHDAVIALRRAGHPEPGRVPRTRLDRTERGFVLEVEETWERDGTSWYCREMMRADLGPDGVEAISVYCTGDWDAAWVAEHAAAVTLIRP